MQPLPGLEQLIDAIADRVAEKLAPKLAEHLLAAGGLPVSGNAEAGKVFWREHEAAAAMGVSAGWLKKMRLRGYITATHNEKPVLYSRQDIDAVAAFIGKHVARKA